MMGFSEGRCMDHLRSWQPACIGILCVVLLGCSSNYQLGSSSAGVAVKLQGSGASFPDPIYQRWFKDFSRAEDGVRVDYTATGSGEGVQALIAKLVDFAGSDAAMTEREMARVDVGVQLLPVTAGSVVLAYHLDNGPAELKLSREAYTRIFLGEITRWNDPAIAATKISAMPVKVPCC